MNSRINLIVIPLALIIAAFIVAGPSFSAPVAVDLKIGVVNLPTVFTKYNETVKEQDNIKTKAKRVQAALEDRAKKLEEDLAKIKMMRPTNDQRRRYIQYEKDRSNLEIDQKVEEEIIAHSYAETTQRLLKKIYDVITEYGKKNNFSLIVKTDTLEISGNFRELQARVSSKAILYHQNDADISDEILKILNK